VARMLIFILGLALASACSPVAMTALGERATSPIDAFLDREVGERRLQGGVAVIVQAEGPIYARPFGYRDRGLSVPAKADDLFRLYSMTKPITTVAVLMLVEEGVIDLNAPVGRYLPEFAAPRVYSHAAGLSGRSDVVLAVNPLTILDLLRHTSGLTYGQGGVENAADYRDAGLLPEVWDKRGAAPGGDNAEIVATLGALPLAFEPGTRWAYGRSTDVLGRLVEVVSGQSLDVFFQERIFLPLGMLDTGFNVGADKQLRVVEPSLLTARGEPQVHMTDLSVQQTFLSGGGGLVGSATDYARFCRMLLNGGELDGVRLLSQRSIDLMMSDQLGSLAEDPSFGLGDGYTFGLGGFVRTIETASGPRQEYGWWGAGGTAFWCDRDARVCGIFFIQQSDETRTFSNQFHDLARHALAN
jgi:CubicO group peptidase (beta-lactamase class C family)